MFAVLPYITAALFILVLLLLFILYNKRRTQQHKKDLDLYMIHELRSPIASVKAASNLLLTQGDQLSDDKKTELLKVINSQSVKLLEYISQLLDTAKLNSGMFSIQKSASDIKKVISERVNLYMPLALEKYITINVHIDEPIPSFFFDPQYIGQVISNLLSNSLKFTPENGHIDIEAKFDGKNVIVTVSDTGVGPNKQDQEKLFNKFYRASNANDTNGSGLGLYFVKSIIEAHGGKIDMVSKENEGTTVSFTLPFVPAPSKVSANN
ncbi:MAG TPA: HAMP domain-containing sensor histidine kinase [Patescibacteria group bacterium]|nr:HAMP domain-containing sensor histidine kinase [Patescibacteria group bacterium]